MLHRHYLIASTFLIVLVNSGIAEDQPAGRDDADSNTRFGPRQIEILVDAPSEPQSDSCQTHVRVTYRVTNLKQVPQQSAQVFPVHLSSWGGPESSNCRVLVNGKPVELNLEPFDSPSGQVPTSGFHWSLYPTFTADEMADWPRRLEEWMQRDPTLRELLTRHRELRSSLSDSRQLYEEFYEEIDRQLIHSRDCRYAAFRVATGETDLASLVKLMPEVDPSLRFDIDFQNRKYISYVDEFHPQSYAAYEAEWEQKVETWLLSMPGFDELIPRLRQNWTIHKESERLRNDAIVKHLHDQCGLNLELSLRLGNFLRDFPSSVAPPREVIETLFPDVRREGEKRESEFVQRLHRWGFEGLLVNPFTGQLFLPTHYRHGFNLSAAPVFPELIEERSSTADPLRPPHNQYWHLVGLPHLLKFDVPLEAMGTSEIVVEYERSLSTFEQPGSSGGTSHSELISVLPPSARNAEADVIISLPSGIHPIISPAPDKVTTRADGRRIFETHLEKPLGSVHLTLIGFQSQHDVDQYAGSVSLDEQTVEAVTRLKNRTVSPPLLVARYRDLVIQEQSLEAYNTFLQLAETDPDFTGLHILREGLESGDEQVVAETYAWFQRKSRSPVFEEEDDLQRFASSPARDVPPLQPEEIAALAAKVQALAEPDLTLEEQMGRHFVLSKAGIDPKQNLSAILALANSDDSAAIPALRLIEGLSIEKPQALPFVLKHLGIKTLSFKDPRRPRQYAASQALYSFRSQEVAKPLIEFIGSTEDSYFIQTAVNVMSEMSLPELFDELVSVADRVAHSSGSAFYNYRDLLTRSNPEAAEPVLTELYRKYPKYARRDSMPREQALHTYQTSDDKQQIDSAVRSLTALGDPTVIAELKYRSNLEAWNNQTLLLLITQKRGFKEAFPFVESFYREFVKDSPKKNPLNCINAFEAMGDPRAIPYLQEIVRTHERKTDAAHAIGTLMLDRRKPYTYDRAKAELISLIDNVDREDRTAEERETSLKTLLEEPENSMKLIMVSSRVRDLISHQSTQEWRDQDRVRFQYLIPFGTIAATHLLEATRGASLQIRYNVAHLLSLLPEETYELLRDAAKDPDAETETRRASILALGMTGDADSVPLLAELMNDEAYRGNAINALANIETEAAREVLQRWKKSLEGEDSLTLRQEVWRSKIQRALHEPE